MDFSYVSYDHGSAVTALPTELAVLFAAFLTRQAASRTAKISAALLRTSCAGSLTAPADGAFHGGVATMLGAWKKR